MEEIELGDTVECVYTGFKGVAVAKTIFINGCVQFSVAPKWEGKQSPMMEEGQIDESSLKITKKKEKPKEDKIRRFKNLNSESGGPTRIGKKMRGF